MKISPYSKTNFCAQYKSTVYAVKLNHETQEYEDYPVSFIQFEPDKNTNDYEALKEIARFWEYGFFTGNIFFSAKDIREQTNNPEGLKIYGVTTQTEDFDNIDPGKILSVADICEKTSDSICINNLQGNPDYIYTNVDSHKKFVKVGTPLSDGLKTLYTEIEANSAPTQNTQNFYERNGYKKQKNTHKYIWRKSDTFTNPM